MSEFNVRADSVNVEQIMDQIRARIRDKRGVDYTEDQIRELASVKLERFLDPRGIRSDLLEQFRKAQPPAPPITLYPFEDTTLFDSHRGIVRLFRRLLRPLMKLFFNSNALAQSLHQQTIINRQVVDRLNAIDQRGDLYYELLHNLVLELTRATVELKNVTMRVESISSRLDFNERRARALESVVVYKTAEPEREARPAAPSTSAPAPQRGGQRYPPPPPPRPPAAPPAQAAAAPTPPPSAPAASGAPAGPAPASAPGSADAAVPGEGPGQRSRRRRRRRGRRGGASAAAVMGSTAASGHGESEVRDTQAEPSGPADGSPAQPAEPHDEASSAAASSQPAPPQPAPQQPATPPAESSATEPPPSSAAHDDDDDQ